MGEPDSRHSRAGLRLCRPSGYGSGVPQVRAPLLGANLGIGPRLNSPLALYAYFFPRTLNYGWGVTVVVDVVSFFTSGGGAVVVVVVSVCFTFGWGVVVVVVVSVCFICGSAGVTVMSVR